MMTIQKLKRDSIILKKCSLRDKKHFRALKKIITAAHNALLTGKEIKAN